MHVRCVCPLAGRYMYSGDRVKAFKYVRVKLGLVAMAKCVRCIVTCLVNGHVFGGACTHVYVCKQRKSFTCTYMVCI